MASKEYHHQWYIKNKERTSAISRAKRLIKSPLLKTTCLQCSNIFTPFRNRQAQKYCSPKCRDRYKYLQQKPYSKERKTRPHYSREESYEKNRLRRVNYIRQKRKEHPEIYHERMLKKKYGITLEYFNKLSESQNGLCIICGNKPSRKLVVDHCHATGKIRGLLCQVCNTGLGMFKDNVGLLNKAISYLGKAEENNP
jgi:hypothetical protein